MGRVEGIQVKLPPAVSIRRDPAAADIPRGELRGLGYCTEFHAVDAHTLEFTFVATTERGEELARRMREGGCWMELVVPEAPSEGMTWRGLQIRIVWERPPPPLGPVGSGR